MKERRRCLSGHVGQIHGSNLKRTKGKENSVLIF
jgi:hypothetical protein